MVTQNFNSADVRVFPTAYRTQVGTTLFNPESRLNTEFNLTNLVNRLASMDNFIVSYDTDSDILILNMHGYWFELKNWAAMKTSFSGTSSSFLWAYIDVKSWNVDYSNNNTTYSTSTLIGDTSTLARTNLDDSNSKFTGLKITDVEPTSSNVLFVLKLWDITNSKFVDEAWLKFKTTEVTDVTSGKPITQKLSTGDITALTLRMPKISFDNAGNIIQAITSSSSFVIPTISGVTNSIILINDKTNNLVDAVAITRDSDGEKFIWENSASISGGTLTFTGTNNCHKFELNTTTNEILINDIGL